MVRRVLLGILILTQVTLAQRGAILGGGGTFYSLTYLVDEGNGLDPALDTSALPNIPRSWRGEALAIVIGADNGMALRGLSDLNNKTGYRSRFDFYLAADSTPNDTFCSIAVGKAISTLDFFDEDTPIAFYLDFYKNTSGERKLRTRIPTEKGTELITTWAGIVPLQRPIRVDNNYDIANENYTLEVEGQTVLDRDFDKGSITSIDTLVLGSSGGSTCRNVTYLIGRVLENPLGAAPFTVEPPAVVPGVPVISSNSPANGATNVAVTGQSLGASSEGALTYDVLLDTVTPPVVKVLDDSPTAGYAMPQLATATTYYWRVNPTNAAGTTTGPIWSFTTVAAPANGDLDLIAPKAACGDSAEDSPTGRNPNLLWTCDRQAVWNQMVDDYEAAGCVVAAACSATPSTRGGRWFKKINTLARTTTTTGDGTANYGQWNVVAYQMTGNEEYITNATWGGWKKITDRYLPSIPFNGLPSGTDVNVSRVIQAMHTLMLEWMRPALTDDQFLTYVAEIDSHNDAGWYVYTGSTGRWTDADQTIGHLYFPFAMMKVILPNNVSNNAIWDDVNMGGFDSTECTVPQTVNGGVNNQRNGICIMFTIISADGEYLEGPFYSEETIPYTILMAEAVSSARGVDTYPEITAFLEDFVDREAASYTPDLQKHLQYADESYPDILRKFMVGSVLMSVAGILQGTDAGDRAHGLLNDMVTAHGEDALFPVNTQMKWWGIPLYNPYADTADWKTSKFHFSSGQGTAYLKSGFTSSDSLFTVHCPEDVNYTNGQYITLTYDHEPWYHCSPQWYANGEWIVTQIGAYAGASAMPEGHSVMRFNGFGKAREFRSVRQRSIADTHLFLAATTGGGVVPASHTGIGKPPTMINEGSRATLHVPASQVAIIHDRASVDEIVEGNTDLSRYALGCGEVERKHITDQHARQEWLWQIPVDPTVNGGVFTWTTPVAAQSVKLTSLLPAAAVRTVFDVSESFATNRTTAPFRCGWSAFSILAGGNYTNDINGYNRKLLKIWPETMGTFHTYLAVVQVGSSTPATPTLISDNDAECAHVVTTGQNDILACFNGATSTVLSDTNYTLANKAILENARLFDAGTRTIPVITVAGTLELHLADLDPLLTWTYNVDAAGAVTIDAKGLTTTGGYARIPLTLAAGAHEVVIVGS